MLAGGEGSVNEVVASAFSSLEHPTLVALVFRARAPRPGRAVPSTPTRHAGVGFPGKLRDA